MAHRIVRAARRVTIATVVAASGFGLIGGTAVATPSHQPSHGTAHRHGTEYFTIVGVGSGDTQTAIMHGLFTAAGIDRSVNDDTDVVTLPHGTITLVHPDKLAKYSDTINPKTCFATFTESGEYYFGGGTGIYKGIHGHGTYTGNGQAILPRTKSGACDEDSDPAGGYFLIHAHGPARLG